MTGNPVVDPIQLARLLWPDVRFFDRQREIVYSVRDNDETMVPAGNMLGKDFVAGFIALWFFMVHREVRVVTTSVKDDHLRVLWGEIDRFIKTSAYSLTTDRGGPLLYNHHEIRKVVDGQLDKHSYLLGTVSKSGEGLSGHHAKNTLLIMDEASGVDDTAYSAGQGWMQKLLVIGNPNECNNFFRRGVKEGDLLGEDGKLYRKVIRIRAEDSPNVKLALLQKSQGREPTNETLVPGVLKYEDGIKGYVYRRKHWDKVRQCVGLDGEFWEGSELLLFPPEWLNRAEQYAASLSSFRKGETIGVDSAAGGDYTAWAVCDHYGLIELRSIRTPDTSVIAGDTLAMMREFQVPAKGVHFDAGGGGKQIADQLRAKGHEVKTVAFGESASNPMHRGMTPFPGRVDETEQRYVYKNKRAEMYGLLSQRLDPNDVMGGTFGLPAKYDELRRQLAPIPRRYDGEGRLYLLPKNKRGPDSTEQTLTELIGRSPDDADALVLAVYGMRHKSRPVQLVSA
jgi:hypothetical protein